MPQNRPNAKVKLDFPLIAGRSNQPLLSDISTVQPKVPHVSTQHSLRCSLGRLVYVQTKVTWIGFSLSLCLLSAQYLKT